MFCVEYQPVLRCMGWGRGGERVPLPLPLPFPSPSPPPKNAKEKSDTQATNGGEGRDVRANTGSQMSDNQLNFLSHFIMCKIISKSLEPPSPLFFPV